MSNAPVRSRRYLDQIEARRQEIGLTQAQVMSKIDSNRETYYRVMAARPRRGDSHCRSQFDTIAAMADAVGLTFALVPIEGGEVPESAPRAEALRVTFGRQPDRVREAAPHSRTLMRWLREARQQRKIKQDDLRREIGISENVFRGIEYGHREPTLDVAIRYAGRLGLSLTPMEPAAARFAELNAESADAVRRLVVSYVGHCVRHGKRIPPGLLDAAEILDDTDAGEGMAA